MKRLFISPAVAFCVALGALSQNALAGDAFCRSSGGGPSVCVRFDNLPDAPEEDRDYNFVFPDPPANPNVILRRGRALDGTLYNWRVWSNDLATADGVGDIGTISSPGDYDYQVKLAANGSPERMLLFRAPSVTPNNDQEWANYAAALPSLRDAGFTHLGLQIDSPTDPDVATRVTYLRDFGQANGMPLALFASPGQQILKKTCNECPDQCATCTVPSQCKECFGCYNCDEACETCTPPQCPPQCFSCLACPDPSYHSSNGRHKKYFDTVWLDDNLDEPNELRFDPNCYPKPNTDCDNHPHTLALDPLYAGGLNSGQGPLWQLELEYLGNQVQAANLQPGDVIVLDFEVFARPSDVDGWYYPNVLANSEGRYTGTSVEDKFNEYRAAWDARAQELVDKCHEFAPPGVRVYFYGREIGEEGWVREGAAPNAEPGPLTLMPIMYYGSPLPAYECHLNHADYSGAVPFIHFSFSRCPESYCCGIVEGCPVCPQNPLEDPPPLEEGTVASCPTWETSITQQIGALLRNEDVNGVVVYTRPNEICAAGPDYLNHSKTLASEITRTTGARNVTAMTLVPTNLAKFSNIAGAEISGNLANGLTVQALTSGTGGEVNISIGGDVSGDVAINRLISLDIGGEFYGSVMEVKELAGPLTIDRISASGAIQISESFGSEGSILVKGDIAGHIHVVGDVNGQIIADSDHTGGGEITGLLTVTGVFYGNLCAENTPGPPFDLPANIHLSQIGPQGTVCNTQVCGGQEPGGLNKTRFISFVAPATGREIDVRLVSLHNVVPPYSGGPSIPFTLFEGQVLYVGPPDEYVETEATGFPPILFKASSLQCAAPDPPIDWSTVGLLHVTGAAIVPSSKYQVEVRAGVNSFCTEINLDTTRWGDVKSPYNPPDPSVQPEISDVSALVDKFKRVAGAPIKARGILTGQPGNAWGEITPTVLDNEFSFSHVSACVDAFRGVPYPYKMGQCAVRRCLRDPNRICTADADCSGEGLPGGPLPWGVHERFGLHA